MKPLVMHHTVGEALTSQQIMAIEEQMNVSLPADYVAFLGKHNGGSPDRNVFPITDFPLDNQGVLASFLGVKHGEDDDLRNYAKIYSNRVPRELLPIGYDVFGNLICLAVAGPNRGKIYWWFHEEEADEGETPTYDNLYFVAGSFNDLLNSLTEFPEDEGE